MALINLDLSNDAPSVGISREPLPPGDYPVIITATEQRTAKNGSNSYLSVELQVTDGPHQGRRVWDTLNLWNSNETAVKIAREKLRAITDAIAHPPHVQDSESLHNKPMLATVGVRDDATYGPKNEVVGYKAGAAARPRAPAPAPAGRTAPPAAGARPAWVK
jgi:hypothetical protein